MINIYRFKIKLINKEKLQKSEMEPKIEKEQVDFKFPLRATFIGSTSIRFIDSFLPIGICAWYVD